MTKGLRLIVIALMACGVLAMIPRAANATLSLNPDQAESGGDIAQNGAPLSAETQRLFRAVRDGDLSAVQQAVLDGADTLAVNADGMNAADLAESLSAFTITHFLRAYQAIEDRSGAPTTVVEAEEPAPLPAPEPEAVPESSGSGTPLSGEGVLPEAELAKPVAEASGETVVIQSPETAQAPLQTIPATDPVSEGVSEELTVVRETAGSAVTGDEELPGDYFARLLTLNPGHEPTTEQQQTVAAPEPEPDVAPNTIEMAEPAEETTPPQPEPEMAERAEQVADEGVASELIQEGLDQEPQVAFAPALPPRKPDADTVSEEPAIFASVEEEEERADPPMEMEEVDVPMLAQVPEVAVSEIPVPEELEVPVEPETGSFFAELRVFKEDPEAEMPDEALPIPSANGINAEGVPEYEQIRTAVIAKLKRESEERSQQLADVRELNREEIEREDMIREHASGTLNIQTELRAKEREAITGTSYPPGYVPPPDGGSSGVRFLQRLGLFDNEDPTQLAEADVPEDAGLPAGMSSQGQSSLRAPDDSVMLPVLTPGNLAQKSMAFVDYGYSAPPAGRAIDTSDDAAVQALGQIARLFQSPNIGYPSATSALPAPATPSQSQLPQNGGIAMPQAPLKVGESNAPLNASDLATPPSMFPETPGYEAPQPTPSVPDIPLSAAELAEIGGPIPPAPAQPSAWDTTTTAGSQNTGVPSSMPAVPAPDGADSGLTSRLAHIFDPANPTAVGSGGAIRDASGTPMAITEPTGSWDVVSVQAAPTAARTLLGGAVVPKTSVAVSGGRALSMGQSVVLGKAPPVSLDPNARKKACIDKRRGSVLFCIERIDWPAQLESTMQVDTVMYQGLNAIVRYDNGVATRFHALFPSESFDSVVAYYVERLGNPTNVWQRTITPLAAPKKPNPTVSWKALNPHSQMTTILEIRQFDDTRGGFPDERRGAVMLYAPQSGVIFPQVSAFELMRLHPGS